MFSVTLVETCRSSWQWSVVSFRRSYDVF